MTHLPSSTKRVNLARDMLQALGLAALAGLGTALASGLVVVVIASAVA
jgi:hypothetical protein